MRIRTVIMQKESLLGVIGLAVSPDYSQVGRHDSRDPSMNRSQFDNPVRAVTAFENMVVDSTRNGWRIVFDGQPSYG